jgi:UDP-glucose 4-epimerase
MKLKTILLTGGSGVVGASLSKRLIHDFKLIAIGTDYSRFSEEIRHHKNFKFYERNLLNIHDSQDLNIPEPVDLVLHLASAVSDSKISEEDYFKINSESTKVLVQFAQEKKCSGFGLASSVSVYGISKDALTINSDRLGESVYARSKIMAENYTKSLKLPNSIFRIASVYGHGTKSFVSKLFSLYKRRIYPVFRAEKRKSLIHVEDLVTFLDTWCRKALALEKIMPIYVISHPESVTIKSVVNEFKNQGRVSKNALPIPIFSLVIPLFNAVYNGLRRLRNLPIHESPLYSLMHSIEIFDEDSWKDLTLSPKWDLRKGISEYQ